MDRRALLVSLLVTLAGVALLRLYMQRFEREATGGPLTRVLVLARDAPAGTSITRELVGLRALPQAYLESRHVLASEIDQVLEAKLGVAVRANETLLWSDLASMRERERQLSKLVPEGMRAFTLALRNGAFDALLAPGDRVDVLLARNPGAGERNDASAQLVAQNLLVLAVGDDTGRADRRHAARGDRTGQLTVCVTPADAARLAQVEQQGSLRVVLRNPEDLKLSETKPPAVPPARAPTSDGVRGEN
jgi:pilus assembly protein CpaB